MDNKQDAPTSAQVYDAVAILAAAGDKIVDEIMDSLNKGLDKHVDPDALGAWKEKLREKVLEQLGKGADWDADKGNVRAVAEDMGEIAKRLSHRDDVIGQAQFDAAFDVVSKHHKRCRGVMSQDTPAKVLGRWCDWK